MAQRPISMGAAERGDVVEMRRLLDAGAPFDQLDVPSSEQQLADIWTWYVGGLACITSVSACRTAASKARARAILSVPGSSAAEVLE